MAANLTPNSLGSAAPAAGSAPGTGSALDALGTGPGPALVVTEDQLMTLVVQTSQILTAAKATALNDDTDEDEITAEVMEAIRSCIRISIRMQQHCPDSPCPVYSPSPNPDPGAALDSGVGGGVGRGGGCRRGRRCRARYDKKVREVLREWITVDLSLIHI